MHKFSYDFISVSETNNVQQNEARNLEGNHR